MYKIDEKLNHIQSLILKMGFLVEQSLSGAKDMVFKKPGDRATLLSKLKNLETKINTLQIKVSRAGFKILARQSPVAGDLRFVLAILSANTDLERMGDLAFNISKKARSLSVTGKLKTKTHPLLKDMFKTTSSMVKGALEALVHKKVRQAQGILTQDRGVNNIRDQIRKTVEKEAGSNPTWCGACMDLLIMAGELERIADHTTNIAEEAIFFKTGDDIRHQKSARIKTTSSQGTQK